MTYRQFLRPIAILIVGYAPALAADVFTDPRDGQDYPTVSIGSLVWMAANLAHPTADSWRFDDQPDDCENHGRLYTWAAAMQACPAGWRLASDEDWIDLETALGMDSSQAFALGPRGSNEGRRLQADGQSGFNAPICGYRRPDGSHARRGERAAFWTASEHSEEDAWHRDIRSSVGTIYRSPVTKTYALSIRCVREQPAQREWADSTCDTPADMTRVISPSSAPLPPDRFGAVTAEMTLGQIIGLLGPAVRDIGSGLHLLEWQSTDGRVFRVSGPSFCERPMNFGFVARVSTLIEAEAKQAVLAAEREWAMAAKQRDLDRSDSFMADDAVMFPPGSAAIVGKSAIREYMAAGFATPGFSVTWEP